MKRVIFLATVAAIVLASVAPVMAQSNPCDPKQAANPCNPCGGKGEMSPAGMTGVPVNPCDAKFGTIYYLNDPMSRNTVSFRSQAPLEDIVGTSNQVSGYLVLDPNNLHKGVKGRIVIPAASLKTGIPLRDKHLQNDLWLNTAAYPEISFELKKLKNVKVLKKAAGYTTYELTVEGPFSLHGKTHTINVRARVTILPESEQTQQKLPGDLVAIRASFQVGLADHGIKGVKGVVGSKVGKTIDVDVSLTATNVNPEAQTQATAGKASNPCNPCGGKAKNPCNPCGR